MANKKILNSVKSKRLTRSSQSKRSEPSKDLLRQTSQPNQLADLMKQTSQPKKIAKLGELPWQQARSTKLRKPFGKRDHSTEIGELFRQPDKSTEVEKLLRNTRNSTGLRKSKKLRQPKQGELFGKSSLSYGGELLKTRKGRLHGRPLDTKNTMHLVLRSSLAKGSWSFRTPKNAQIVKKTVTKFAQKYGIKIISLANVGNHLHFQIKLSKRQTYKAFIRAVTSAIAMKITGVSRWMEKPYEGSFWDLRPFTRVVRGYKAFLTLKDYILLNQLEGFGVKRHLARALIQDQGSGFAKEFLKTARAP